jgi:hypothetical protein
MVSMCHLLFLTNTHEPFLHLLRAYHLLQSCEEFCLHLYRPTGLLLAQCTSVLLRSYPSQVRRFDKGER